MNNYPRITIHQLSAGNYWSNGLWQYTVALSPQDFKAGWCETREAAEACVRQFTGADKG